MPFSVSLRPDGAQLLAALVHLEVAEQDDVLGRCRGAFLQAGMGEGVHDDMVGAADEALDHAEARGPAGREQSHVIHLQELGDLALERDRMRRVADKRGRAGAVDAVVLDRLLGDGLDGRMRGQAEIILRGEVDAAHADAAVVARRAFGGRAFLGRAAERPQAVLAAQILPAEEAVDACEKIASLRNAEIPHAARQRSRRGIGMA